MGLFSKRKRTADSVTKSSPEMIAISREELVSRAMKGLAGTDLGDKFFKLQMRALFRGEDSVFVSREDYLEYQRIAGEREEAERRMFRTRDLNNAGLAFEKSGEIEKAIAAYEENIAIGEPATCSYERLMILYHRACDFENEKRVILRAIAVFSAKGHADIVSKYEARLENLLKKQKSR